MNIANLITDPYERKARLYPALVTVAPIAFTGAALLSERFSLSTLQSWGATLLGLGGAFLMAQLARDEGKRCEPRLYVMWDGMPSMTIFRHRDKRLDAITKGRYHKTLPTLVKGAKDPTAEDEAQDPAAADVVYMAWSNYIRTHARDTKKFPLLFQENVNYGYRRNLWGLRPVGISLSICCAVVAAVGLYWVHSNSEKISEELVIALIFALLLAVLWIFKIKPDWVRIPADAYALRLAEVVETLGEVPKTAAKNR